ncbi:hypothetical protein AUP68_17794 [Ilyonectria robusta]
MNNLMIELGFGDTGYVAQGGDVGSGVCRILGARHEECRAVHLNFCLMPQPAGISKEALTFNERAGVERMKQFSDTSSAYALEHGSRPATIGLVLGSNPVSLLACQPSTQKPSAPDDSCSLTPSVLQQPQQL